MYVVVSGTLECRGGLADGWDWKVQGGDGIGWFLLSNRLVFFSYFFWGVYSFSWVCFSSKSV